MKDFVLYENLGFKRKWL